MLNIFPNLLISAVLCKQRVFHENELVQFIWNYKYFTLIKAFLESTYNVFQMQWKYLS